MNADRDAWTRWAETHPNPRTPVAQAHAPAKANKYHAIPVHVDGRRFASQKEAARFLELQLWQQAGQIADLVCHPVYPLLVHLYGAAPTAARVFGVVSVGRYTADFRYLNLTTGEIVVEDVKSTATKTTAYRLRKKLAEAIHGITVTEV
jgi:hypothetical protein